MKTTRYGGLRLREIENDADAASIAPMSKEEIERARAALLKLHSEHVKAGRRAVLIKSFYETYGDRKTPLRTVEEAARVIAKDDCEVMGIYIAPDDDDLMWRAWQQVRGAAP